MEGWDEFEGHTPHRPWVDAVKVRCSKCGGAGQPRPRRRQSVAGRRNRAVLDAALSQQPRVLAAVVSRGLHHRELSGPVPQLVLLDAGDGRCAGRHSAVQNGAGLRHAVRPERRGDAQEQGQQHPLRRGGRHRRRGHDALALHHATRRSRTCAFRISPPRRRPTAARGKGQPPRLNELWMQTRAPLDKLWNVYSFFVTYANIDGFDPTARTLARPSAATWIAGCSRSCRRRCGGRRRALVDFDAEAAALDGGVVHRESLELVRAPQPPALLEERGGRRQGRRLPDALRVPGDGDEAAGADHALPGRVALPESGALAWTTARPKACISPTGR